MDKGVVGCSRLYPLSIISRKWSYLVLRALREPRSFSELQKELRFITNHILTRELRLLHEEKLIVMDSKYKLTAEGKALYEAAEPLVSWSVKHAGLNACPPDRKCSACINYQNVVGAHTYMIGGNVQE